MPIDPNFDNFVQALAVIVKDKDEICMCGTKMKLLETKPNLEYALVQWLCPLCKSMSASTITLKCFKLSYEQNKELIKKSGLWQEGVGAE